MKGFWSLWQGCKVERFIGVSGLGLSGFAFHLGLGFGGFGFGV